MSEEIADVIDSAADVLEQVGWVQYHLVSLDGLCIVGSLCHATNVALSLDVPKPVMEAVEQELFVHRGETWPDLPGWNDHPGRTADEVKDLLRAAAKRQRSEV